MIETPSGQNVQLTLRSDTASSLLVFYFSDFTQCCCFLITTLSDLIFDLSFVHLNLISLCALVMRRLQLDSSLLPLFPPKLLPISLSLSLFLSLWKTPAQLEPRRLKRGAWERRNKGPSICSHHHSAPPLPPRLPSFPPLVPSLTGQCPKLRLQTRK